MKVESILENETQFEQEIIKEHIGKDHITEDMLTEGFIDEKLTPALKKIFRRKAENKDYYEQKREQKINEAKTKLSQEGIDVQAVEKKVEEKAEKAGKSKNRSVFITQLKELFRELGEEGIIKSLTKQIPVIILILFINSFMFVAFFHLTGNPNLAMYLNAVLIAPVTEEVSRYVTMKRKQGGAFLITFNIAEYFTYVFQAAAMGVSVPAMAITRLLPVLFHSAVSAFMRRDMEKGVDDKKVLGKAMALHAFANATFIGIPVITAWSMIKRDDSDKETKKVKKENMTFDELIESELLLVRAN